MRSVRALKSRVRGWTQELWHHVHLWWTLLNVERRNPILVYQMGKVGSSTVVRTLERLDLDAPVLHVHTLDPDHLQLAVRKERASTRSHLPEHLIASSILVDRLEKRNFPCRVITLTREPVGRAISFAFEDWKKKAPEAKKSGGSLDGRAMSEAVTQLLRPGSGHANPGQWFERELHNCLGIDVFAEPYDIERGFSLVRNGPVTALIIRVEDLDRALTQGLAALLEMEISRRAIQRANTGRKKWYADALHSVKTSYRLPAGLAEFIFGTRYVNHFYGGELDRLRARWTKGLGADSL
jgi:hypothetical protein